MKKIKNADGWAGKLVIYAVVLFAAMITLYPFVYILANSLSAPTEVLRRTVWLLPKQFSLMSYRELLKQSEVLVAYYNTVWYTLVGTAVNIVFTVTAAYALSVRKFFCRRQVSLLVVITMFINGGIIPLYIIVNHLGLYNTRWALVFPTAISAYNLIVARSYFSTIPEALSESAKIDGANDIVVLARIIVPVAKPILAVLAIFYAVGHWNEYFNPLIYLASRDLKPIQLYLRGILTGMQMIESTSGATGVDSMHVYEVLKYSNIIITVLPITIVYPFFQKYFIQGVMIGAVKG